MNEAFFEAVADRGRRVLLVFPAYAHSFGTFEHAYPLMPGVRAFMPPQGLLVLAAYLPATWSVRFVDENIERVSEADLAWADVVLITGMHVQRRRIEQLIAAAHRHDKPAVVGGPSVSAAPEYYAEADYRHVGELGDATDELIDRLNRSAARPAEPVTLETVERLPLRRFPRPAYHLADMRRYFLGSVQFSSGCPFLCEFCDIPALYGRNPRIKTPTQVVGELDEMMRNGLRNAVYFVDDNFIANPAAARRLLPHLVEWQKRTGYKVQLCCEATLNLAGYPDILELMREANFATVFVGIETPEPAALEMMQKKQNMRQPMLESIRTLNGYGIEVVSGIILGLDSDTAETGDRILEFIEGSQIPMLTINLLYALPKTKLHERLLADDRLTEEPGRASNVVFAMPYEQVMGMWREVIEKAYEPAALLRRFAYQAEHTYPNRVQAERKVDTDMVRFGMSVIGRSLWRVGVRSDWRREFWKTAGPLLMRGRVEDVMHMAIVCHHLITFARQCASGEAEAAFYADPNRGEAASEAEAQPEEPVLRA